MSERFPKYNLEDSEEDSQIHDIRNKISSLKAISIDIGSEVREHNSLLDRMGVDFETTGGFLDGSMKMLRKLSKSEKGRSYLLYTLLFIIGLFLFFYFLVL